MQYSTSQRIIKKFSPSGKSQFVDTFLKQSPFYLRIIPASAVGSHSSFISKAKSKVYLLKE